MGLLDDAIREHLELKRRHGADPGEVERQEREALGAPRQAEFAASGEPAAEPAEAAPEPEPFEAEPAEPAEVAEPSAAAPAAPAEEREPFDVEALEPAADEIPAPPEPEVPAPGEEAGAPGYDEDPWLEEDRDEVPAGESLDHPREGAEEPAEDVLEDTPDFLQETPEHDRLWFEQRPPRDFDWDK